VNTTPGPEPTDLDLVRRFQAGDQSAFTLLVERHERRVYNLAYRMLGRAEEARDASQEAFISCFRHLGAFRGDAAFTTWIHRITVNACYDMLRKKVPEPVEDIELPGPISSPDHADQAATAVDVQRALVKIHPDYRAVLILFDVQGIPYEEIAAALQIPLGTVKSRLHRGRAALGLALTGEPASRSRPSKRATS
jgi:RNA polymerase sigma-70 factor (ECF subfamily)